MTPPATRTADEGPDGGAVDLQQPLVPDGPDLPHSASSEDDLTAENHEMPTGGVRSKGQRHWTPKRVVVTPAALDHPHGLRILERVEALGIEVERLSGNRLTGVRGETDRQTYARAKSTLAVVVSPPSKRKLQPISPSADWRVDLAEGCPAHCQYCYLAGSLSGPPVTRVYADLDEILDNLTDYAGTGTITSRSKGRADEGTTFEASCYSDPLSLDHLTGSWQRAVEHFGAWEAPVQLRWTTKFDDVERFLPLDHGGRTRVRLSVNCLPVTTRWEGGTSSLEARLAALRALAAAGYPIGLTIAPIMAIDGWREHYGHLLTLVQEALEGVPDVDLTAELITHRFTAASKDVLTGWYPRTTLEMDEARRSVKRGKFGNTKHVYPKEVMAELRSWFHDQLGQRLPDCRILYWT